VLLKSIGTRQAPSEKVFFVAGSVALLSCAVGTVADAPIISRGGKYFYHPVYLLSDTFEAHPLLH
jgi:hypothetical protein